jgi:hypothetical protein
MSTNFNHLKLTPERLAEWGDRRSSKYFNFFQHSQNNVRDNPQDHKTNHERSTNEINQEREKNLHPLPFSNQENDDSNKSVQKSDSNSHLDLPNDLQVEKQDDYMSLDNEFGDYLKDSEYIRNIDHNEMNLKQDFYKIMNIDSNMETVDLFEDCMDHDAQRLKNNETSNQEQIFNPVSENKSNLNLSIISDQKNNLSENDTSNFLKTMQDVVPTIENQKIDKENTYEETYFNIRPALQCNPIFSNEKYNKMKESSRLRASNPNISHFMKTVIPNKKSDFDRDMEVCNVHLTILFK